MTGARARPGGRPLGRRGLLRLGLAAASAGGLAGLVGACAKIDTAPEELPHYTLRPGDRIAITVHTHPDLSGEMDLDGNGMVRLPLAGTVSLAGLTVRSAESRIVAELEGVWIRGASVTVKLVAHAPVFVLGEVHAPGRFAYRPGMTVLEAVALAGGYTYRARRSSVIIRRPDRLGLSRRMRGDEDTPLLPGDGVEVRERMF